MGTTAVRVALMVISSMAVGQAAGGDPVAASRPATQLPARAEQMVNVTLLDDQGKPLPQVNVSCSAMNGDGLSLSEYSRVTNADGKAAIRCPPGAVRLRVFTHRWNLNWHGSVDVPCGTEWPMEVVLKAQHTLSLSGQVVDEKDQPVRGATVGLRDPRGQPAGVCRAPSDATGRFAVAGIPGPGEYELLAWGPAGLEAAKTLTVRGSRDDLTLKGVYRPKIDRVELVLKWPPTATQPACPVEDYDGILQLVQGPFKSARRFMGGRCVMDNVRSGRHAIYFLTVSDFLPATTTIDLQPSDRERTIEVVPRPTVPVQVLNAETGAPVPQAVVQLYEPTAMSTQLLETLRTDASGKAMFSRGCFAGQVLVSAGDKRLELASRWQAFDLKDQPNGVVVMLPKLAGRAPTTGPAVVEDPPPPGK